MAVQKTIIVSAPGKIHFLGEHVVVYGKPALIATIDKHCTVRLAPRRDKRIEIASKNFDTKTLLTLDEILEKRALAERNWKTFLKNGDVELLRAITEEVLDYAVIAVGETIKHYNNTTINNGFTLTIDSSIPVGSGNGSSAAIAVTIAAAICLFLGEVFDKQTIFDIAFATEQRKHGRPSGGDPATVLFGGLVWFRKETNNLKIIEPVPFTLSEKLARNFSMIDTGKPNESTGEMIAIVKQFYETDKGAKNIFDEQERLTRDLVDAIKNEDERQIMEILKRGERNLETMGVVSAFVKKLIRAIEKAGGAAKISGGGGKTKGTGMLLVYHPDGKTLKNIVQSSKLQTYPVRLGGEGLRIL